MDLNLNDNTQFGGGTAIFNGGDAGEVKDVTIRVERKGSDDHQNAPDFKLYVSDGAAEMNGGFYYPTKRDNKSAEENIAAAKREIGRVLSVAKAVMGDDYKFPEVKTPKEAFDVLFKIIEDNSEGKKFRVFANYGTSFRPSSYLNLRYFDFIRGEHDDRPFSRNNNDVLERIEPDKKDDDALNLGGFDGLSDDETDDSWI